MVAENVEENLDIFRDSLSIHVIAKLTPKPTKKPKKRLSRARRNSEKVSVEAAGTANAQNQDADDLSDFVEVPFQFTA